MSTYTTRLIGSEPVADRTAAFHFEKPSGFTFRAGQAIDLLLPTLEDNGQAARHAFSLVSAPDEERLTIATRLRGSRYKECLQALPPGATAHVDGPFGSLSLHKDGKRDAVMIAGGIGITPFVSILRQAAQQRLERRFILIYSNRRAEDAAYLDELIALSRAYTKLQLISTLTRADAAPPAWAGRVGRVDGALVAGIATNAPVYYVAGPPPFVEAMQGELCSQGADEDDIRSEGFYGY
jgi:ferredoxin-NADP reductase